MRKIADIRQTGSDVKRAMMYECSEGVYVFTYASADDGPSTYDDLVESIAIAEQMCADRYGIAPSQWTPIPDPLPGCQHDWIAPVRVKQDENGKKLWGEFEPLPRTHDT